MALLEDPTIQRILDEVNKAASGGAFGLAGNYISDPDKLMQATKKITIISNNNNNKLHFFIQHQICLISMELPISIKILI